MKEISAETSEHNTLKKRETVSREYDGAVLGALRTCRTPSAGGGDLKTIRVIKLRLAKPQEPLPRASQRHSLIGPRVRRAADKPRFEAQHGHVVGHGLKGQRSKRPGRRRGGGGDGGVNSRRRTQIAFS